MKRALCLMVGLILISSMVYAKEIGQGSIALTGTTGLGFNKSTTSIEGMDDLETTTFGIEVNGEYYFMPNIGVGIIFMYDSMEQDLPMDGTYESSSMMVGPQVVYNIDMNEQVSIPIFAAFGSVSMDDDGEDISGWAWAVGGGLRYFVRDNISFDGYLVYDSMSLENDVKYDITDFGGQVGISIYLGGE